MKATISYLIHQNSSSATSPVVFRIILALKDQSRNGNAIGWKIETLKLRQPQTGGGERTWTKANPTVPTADGLWWITHANAANPVGSEFARPPHLIGTAIADSAGYANMTYDFEGVGNPTNWPWNITAILDFIFKLVGQSEPEEEGEDEPVEVDDDIDPS